MLKLKEVWSYYGPVAALKGVTLDVPTSKIVAVLGPNGAGKTTLLRTISGIVRARSGEIRLNERRVDRLGSDKIVRLGIAQVPEGRQLFPELSVAENLRLGAYTRRDGRNEVQRDLMRVFRYFPMLRERLGQAAGTLSGGEQQMLAIARGLMAHPKLLLLDEPSLGLSPMLVKQLFQAIRELNEEGTTTLLAEQNARQALAIAHTAYVLELGQIMLSGPSDELSRDERVRQRYLGVKAAAQAMEEQA